jgi:hypothetical protein
MAGIAKVVEQIRDTAPLSNHTIVWINLREEPLIYINGLPYVLRDQYFTLRNLRSYSGITEARLELLESRLKEDVVKEIGGYDGEILLHEEDKECVVVPVWTGVHSENVMTLKEAMEQVRDKVGVRLDYQRVPITAEATPEDKDFDQILQIICRGGLDSVYVM